MGTSKAAVAAGDALPVSGMTGLVGQDVALVPERGWVHLQFLRFAGCPICNLHVRRFVDRRQELDASDVREVLVFHSSIDELTKYEADLPFTAIPDPSKRYYALFGVETSLRAVANPRAWGSAVRGMAADAKRARDTGAPMPPMRPTNGELGLPADFLIGADGVVAAAKYGKHAADQWEVDEVLAIAAASTADPLSWPKTLHSNDTTGKRRHD